MMTNDYGTLARLDDGPRVTFERVLDAAIDTVWAMLTTDDGLERWLAPARVDLHIGGNIDIDFGDDGMTGGEIIDLVPGVSLEYHWRFTGEPDSIIRFDLEVVGDHKTKIRLDHRLLPEDQAAGYGAGWHAHLDQLTGELAGHRDFDWMGRFSALMPEYEAMAG